MRACIYIITVPLLLIAIPSCGTRPPGGGDDNTCDLAAPQCREGLVCEATAEGIARCFLALTIRGVVLDATSDDPVIGSLIQAVDVNGAAVGTSAASGEDGSFMLTVPAVRDVDGVPVEGTYTLRAQAATYQAFPSAIRPALPLDAATAALEDNGWVIDNALTTVSLLPLPGDTSNLGSISGQILAERNSGILVVAEDQGSGYIGFSDADGLYTIFNIPPGSYTVRGYAAGVQLSAAVATLESGENQMGVDLTGSEKSLSRVSGNVQIVNAPGGAVTSVVLAVESTFVEAAGRGTVPPGLRVGNVLTDFAIEDVPDGTYVVLAAFENDRLVRDPDQTIGGTQIVRIEVPDPTTGNVVELSEGFKVTGALAVIAPGPDGPEEVLMPTPAFEWQDDSSEDGYEIRVFDAFGEEVWSDEIGPVSGSATVTLVYAGPPLEVGMFYQFRATSFREKLDDRTAISSTEDLAGVFQYLVGP